MLIEVCSVLLTCLTREKSSPRVYIHPFYVVFFAHGAAVFVLF